jgi:ABC-2 type transport system ATP-binding protein
MTWLHDAIIWLGGLLIGLAAAIGLGGDRGPLHVQGYVEGEYVYVGAPVAGRLETLHVARGAQVAAGAPLFQLDRSSEQPARDEAAARLARAEANLANLRKGKRRSHLRLSRSERQRQDNDHPHAVWPADAGCGTGRCLGHDLIEESAAIKREVGYMPQRFGLYEDLSIKENLDFVARLYGVPEARRTVGQTLERLGLAERARQLAGQLSGGWKQRLALAACLLHAPRLLLLDEPTAGVDPKARREFWDQIHDLAAHGMTVLVSTHYMDEAERCHEIGYLAGGKLLVHGSVAAVLANSGLATFEVAGRDLEALAADLRGRPGVEMAAAFGASLHVSGTDPALLEASIEPYRSDPRFRWTSTQRSLEDVFIHTLARAGVAAS